MIIRQLKIMCFRGIKFLETTFDSPMLCLIGPGDSTKSTILDAIEHALSPRWNLPFFDTDFYQCDHSVPIVIEVTVGLLPKEWLAEDKYGLHLRGWTAGQKLVDEPSDECEPVLTIRLTVDATLEPRWVIKTDRNADGRTLSAKERERFGVTRLGKDSDRHFTWGRGTALSRATSRDEELPGVLAGANRQARDVVANARLANLTQAAELGETIAGRFGVKAESDFRVGLDPRIISTSGNALALHDGVVPLSQSGLGTRRLVSLALQCADVRGGAIVLIDELEHGLEPYRLLNLLRLLKENLGAEPPEQMAGEGPLMAIGQVLMTSHSPTAISELDVAQIGVVRTRAGRTTIRRIEAQNERILRKTPQAFLNRKIIVCEGETEEGMCRGLEAYWSTRHGNRPLAYSGTGAVVGQGTDFANRAVEFLMLGYEVAVFGDSDATFKPNAAQLTEMGISVCQWAPREQLCTEQRVTRDLPWEHFLRLVALAVEIKGEQSVFDVWCERLESTRKEMGTDVNTWLARGIPERIIREQFALAAGEKRWFKKTMFGEQLGELVADALPHAAGTDLAAVINSLGDWIYA